MSELRGEVRRLEAVKEELEKDLDAQTNQMHKQVKGWRFYKGSLAPVVEVEKWLQRRLKFSHRLIAAVCS